MKSTSAARSGLIVLFAAALAASAAPANTPVFLDSWGGSGNGDGQFDGPMGIAVNEAMGQVYVADFSNHRVQVFDIDGTYLGQWSGSGGAGQFYHPHGVAVNATGQVYVAEAGIHRMQRFDADLMNSIQWGSAGAGNGYLIQPRGVAVNVASGVVYVADSFNNRIQRFDADGDFIDLWGGGPSTPFNRPWGVAIGPTGMVYVADTHNHRIQWFDATGADYQGQWGGNGSGDGQFKLPTGLAVSDTDLVYVADSNNHRIQRFTSGGAYQSQWGTFGAGNGQFNAPTNVAVTGTGLVYVADVFNNRVQRFLDYASWVEPAAHSVPGDIEFDSDFTLDAGKSLSVTDTATISAGTLKVISGGRIDVSQTFDVWQSGTVQIESGGIVSAVNIELAGTLEGNGTLVVGAGQLTNAGVVSPGLSVGQITVAGNYVQQSGGRLAIELAGTDAGRFDRLVVTGSATLDGALNVSLIDGFMPQAGDLFDILDWSGVTGTFATLDLPPLADGLVWNATELDAVGALSVALAGDFNFDGSVDAADYVVWRNGLGITHTLGDFGIWRANFGRIAGSGSAEDSSSQSGVPEPATLLQAAIINLAFSFRRRGLGVEPHSQQRRS